MFNNQYNQHYNQDISAFRNSHLAGQSTMSNVNNNLNNSSYYFIGCFNDSVNNRTFPTQAPGIYTIDQCARVASNSGANFFGMQFPQSSSTGNQAQCFYGVNPDYARLGTASCTSRFQTTNGLPLGDASINAVYKLNNTTTIFPKDYTYLGCYVDSVNNRALKGGNGTFMTVQACAALAKQNNARYFGLQYSNGANQPNTAQCFYGNSGYATYGLAPTNGCGGVDSNGNILGSSNTNAVYQLNQTTL